MLAVPHVDTQLGRTVFYSRQVSLEKDVDGNDFLMKTCLNMGLNTFYFVNWLLLMIVMIMLP